jgi:hypothetical protein
MKYNEKKRYQIAMRRLYSSKTPSKQIINLIGCDKESFVEHINKYLLDGMTFENFGKVWGLDHIVPVDLFNFDDLNDLKLCYNFLNIMPMFNDDNRLKGASVHFSIEKLNLLRTEFLKTENGVNSLCVNVCDTLIYKCNEEIIRTYQKYLTPL